MKIFHKMINQYLILLFFYPIMALGQTVIGNQTANHIDAILGFSNTIDNIKGIVLPAVDNLPVNPTNGTFLFDRIDEKVKMYQNGGWTTLSDAGDTSGLQAFSGTETNKKTVLGAKSTSVDGVLVLEDNSKALLLPKIEDPHLNVPSPYPGMMCYDTSSKSLAVYDGANWNYWK